MKNVAILLLASAFFPSAEANQCAQLVVEQTRGYILHREEADGIIVVRLREGTTFESISNDIDRALMRCHGVTIVTPWEMVDGVIMLGLSISGVTLVLGYERRGSQAVLYIGGSSEATQSD